MFYVLNFQSHTFASLSSIGGALEAAQMLLDNGVSEDAVETSAGEYGFVFGRRSSGSFDIWHLDGKKISAGISYKKISLVEHPDCLLFEPIAEQD